MTDGTPPGVAGPVGAPTYPPKTRATQAWANLIRALVVDAPKALNETKTARVRMLRPRR